MDIEPGKIINSMLGVLKSGVDNFVSSTVSITIGLLSTAMNISIGFVFACYVLLSKEKLLGQVKKALYALLPEKPVRYLAHVWNLSNRIFSSFITGQCIEAVNPGKHVFCFYVHSPVPLCHAGGSADWFYSIDPIVWRNYRMLDFLFPDPYGKPHAGGAVPGTFPDPSAD